MGIKQATKRERSGKPFLAATQQRILAGVLTLIPIWVTWLVFGFLLGQLSKWGQPVVNGLANLLRGPAPSLAQWVLAPSFQTLLAALWMLAALYVIGWVATLVIGRRIISAFDQLMERIPVAKRIYGSTKKLVAALQQKPDNVQRVVLIEFPTPEMRAVGFVTRTFKDADTGREVAAVYVPTTPNPTSGYLEIVPIERLTSTDWSIDDAMTFIISGGAVAPDTLSYSGKSVSKTAASQVQPASQSSDARTNQAGIKTSAKKVARMPGVHTTAES